MDVNKATRTMDLTSAWVSAGLAITNWRKLSQNVAVANLISNFRLPYSYVTCYVVSVIVSPVQVFKLLLNRLTVNKHYSSFFGCNVIFSKCIVLFFSTVNAEQFVNN